jgi:hypothetical protein
VPVRNAHRRSRPAIRVEVPALCERCLEHDLGLYSLSKTPIDKLLSRGDFELLVEVLDVVIDAVTLFEQLGLHTVPGSRLLARLLASLARC